MIRRISIAAAIALVVACAAPAPVPPAETGAVAPASPTSPPAVPTIAGSATPTASPSGPAQPSALDARFGFLMAAASGASLYVRRETSDAAIFRLPGRYAFAQVSPDGATVAYWEGDAAGLHVLRTFPLARPATVRTVYETQEGSGFGAVWSSDGTGLLFGVVSGERSQLLGADLASGTSRELAANTGPAGVFGRSDAFIPLAWDRQRRLALAFEGGEGGFAYRYLAVSEDGQVRRWQHTTDAVRYTSIEATLDARWAWSVSLDEPKALRIWRADDYDAATSLKATGADSVGAVAGPASQIVVVHERALRLLDPATGAERTLHASADYIAATPILLRADGGAALLQVRASTGVRYEMVDTRTGAVTVVATGAQDAFLASLRVSP